jgi:hypothetical protein
MREFKTAARIIWKMFQMTALCEQDGCAITTCAVVEIDRKFFGVQAFAPKGADAKGDSGIELSYCPFFH